LAGRAGITLTEAGGELAMLASQLRAAYPGERRLSASLRLLAALRLQLRT
jgi:hypothetical protein